MRKSLEGINQKEFAKVLNVSDSAVSYILSGQRTPSLHLAKKMALHRKLSLGRFLKDLDKEINRRREKAEARKSAWMQQS